MSDSLKDYNLSLYGLMAMNLAIFYVVLQNESLFTGNWSVFTRSLDGAVPSGIGIALTGIINAQLTADVKARIVYMRWDNPLPGSEAFTKYIKCDPRINVTALETSYGPFPSDPAAQNALWYKLYRSVESEPAVLQVHRAFLFARDYTSLSLMVGAVLGVAAFVQFPSIGAVVVYLLFLTLQFAAARQAASNHGRRFVTTVLALKAAGQ